MSDELELYKKYPSMFFNDFFSVGNKELNIEITERNVQSGLWFSATWKAKGDGYKQVSAQTMQLMFERLMKEFCQELQARKDLF